MSSEQSSATEYGSEKSEKVHSVVGIIFIVLLLGLLGIVYVAEQHLPTALSISDEEMYPNSFITERAKNSLKALTDLGPRITGGHTNEVLTVNLLKKEIRDILKSAHPGKTIEVDVQTATGAYAWSGMGSSLINTYANIQNVVVKLHGKNAKHSILVNAHFDTKPLGPGGSDDGINCANILEILRKLSTSEEDFKHNIIFLLNGAEEQGLQGSHAFITQHKWAIDVKIVINLDAAGAGGKMTLFRAGPKRPWLMHYYNKVQHPSASVLSEEIFTSGAVPSDTDFSVFTRIGGIVGFDLGYYKDGYRYHTSYDGFENIPDGTYQHGGEIILTLTRNLANAPELDLGSDELSSDNSVYYDYLGFFMIYYNETTGIVINVLTIIVFVCVFVKSMHDLKLGFSRPMLKRLFTIIGMVVLGWIVAAAFVIIIALLLDVSKQSLRWFSNIWLILGLYAIPVLTITCGSIVVLNYLTRNKALSVSATSLFQAHAVTLIWSVILLMGTILKIRSIFCVQLLVLFQTISYLIIIIAPKKWQVVYVVCSIFPSLCIMEQAIMVVTFFVPVTGRMGTGINTELFIGLITVLFTLLVTSTYVPLITAIRKPEIILGLLTSLFVLFLVLALTPIGFPYRGSSVKSPTPQRYWIHHTSRTLRNDNNEIYKSNGGFYLSNMDRNSPVYVEKLVSDFVNVTELTEDCEKVMFCGLPLAKLRKFGVTWIPAEKPILQTPINLTLDSKTSVTDKVSRFSFTATGPVQMEIYISPKPSSALLGIDLIPEKPNKIQLWNERPVYVIHYTCGKESVPLKFSINVEAPSENWKKPLIDIALVGRYIQIDTNVKTEHYKKFIEQFPEWSDVVPWLAAYESWVY